MNELRIRRRKLQPVSLSDEGLAQVRDLARSSSFIPARLVRQLLRRLDQAESRSTTAGGGASSSAEGK